MAPLTAAELMAHPEFDNVTWNLTPTRKESIFVANGRGGPIKIVYEIHGHGPIHLVWVMGLGAMKGAWQRQTKDFGHDQASKYSCMIIDNRGMGESDKPLMRYSTSEMAKDVFEVLDHAEWTGKRSVHVCGISMGGMIAQEMAMQQPERLASLTLLSTAARLKNTVGYFENLRDRINMFIPKNIDVQVDDVKHRLFGDDWLNAPDTDKQFPTNGDRYAASEIQKRLDTVGFTRTGFMCQAIAAGWHYKSPEQLKQIGDTVGRNRIQVIHGTTDRMITFPHAEVLSKELSTESEPVKFLVYKNYGHVIPVEDRPEFKKLFEDWIAKIEALNKA